MEAQERKVQNPKQGEEDVLDFNLEDISLEDIDQEASGGEEDIIELTDLVERGIPLEQKAEKDVVDLLTKDEAVEEKGEFELSTEDLAGMEEVLQSVDKEKPGAEPDVAEFALELDPAPEQKKAPQETKAPEEMITDVDLEQILKEDSAAAVSETEPEEKSLELEEVVSAMDLDTKPEKPMEEPLDLISEDLLKAEEPVAATPMESSPLEPEPLPQVEPPAPAAPAAEAVQEPLKMPEAADLEVSLGPAVAGISEEQMEAVVTRVVQDVVPDVVTRVVREAVQDVVPRVVQDVVTRVVQDEVNKVVQDVLERVAKETMASVAERVIGEAIESLKKSLVETA